MNRSPWGRSRLSPRPRGASPSRVPGAGAAASPTRHGGTVALVAAVIGLLLAMVAQSPASAAAYRYWSYWQGANGTWVAAQTGPGEHELVDRDIQGWRFGITTDAPAQTPDNAPDFAALCPDLDAADAPAGQVRVAVVVDSGYVAHAPAGETPPADRVSCVSLSEGSTGNQALAAAGQVTEKSGLICAINGYPASECGAEVSDADAAAAASAAATEAPNPAAIQAGSPSEAPSDSGSGAAPRLLISAVILGMVAVAALLMARRRRPDTDA